MKILSVTQLALAGVHVIRFARFRDHRGYFTEPFRKSDFQNDPRTPFMRGVEFYQANESYSNAGTIRGLHFQWNPYMGKLVRTLQGHMVDVVLDIRQGSPTYGKVIAHDMPSALGDDWAEWIWVPPGFAHGNFFPTNSLIEYSCSGEYSPGNEAGLSPLATDLDWSLCEPALRDRFKSLAAETQLITDKDRNGLTLAAWTADPRAQKFVYPMP